MSASPPSQLLLLSAPSDSSLRRVGDQLADYLERCPEVDLRDIAYTLQTENRGLEYRRALVVAERREAAAMLRAEAPARAALEGLEVAFLLDGEEAQHPEMGRALYRGERVFRRELDRCADLLQPYLDRDLRQLLLPLRGDRVKAGVVLREPAYAQPVMVAFGISMARLWMSWGVRPAALLGHGVGEIAAACLAGVVSLEDALRLAAVRGRLIQGLARGRMLTVPLSEGEVAPMLGDDLSLAAVDRDGVCVVSGLGLAVVELAEKLAEAGIEVQPLHSSRALNSSMMEAILDPFLETLSRTELRPPRVPCLSNVTGVWLRPEEATDPEYWGCHLRGTVRFADGVRILLADSSHALLEMGPGDALASAIREHSAYDGRPLETSLPSAGLEGEGHLLRTAGRLWLEGVEIDMATLWRGRPGQRVTLPDEGEQEIAKQGSERRGPRTDPLSTRFLPPPDAGERQPNGAGEPPRASQRVEDWLYVPVWKRSPRPQAEWPAPEHGLCLLFMDAAGLGAHLTERLIAHGLVPGRVVPGDGFAYRSGTFTLRPGHREDYEAMLRSLRRPPRHIFHLWSVTGGRDPEPEEALEQGVYSLSALTEALRSQDRDEPVDVVVAADRLHDVGGDEPLSPLKAALLGPGRALAREIPHVRCRCIDPGGSGQEAAANLLSELTVEPEVGATAVAYRGSHRYIQLFEPLAPPPARAKGLRRGGVVLITGGLGRLGCAIGEHLALHSKAKLVLVGRTPLPKRGHWRELLETAKAPLGTKLERLLRLEAQGVEVLALSADVANRREMKEVVVRARQAFGSIDAVVHAVGVSRSGSENLRSRHDVERVISPKVHGFRVLTEVLGGVELDFVALFSSLSGELGGQGMSADAAASATLDAFAEAHRRRGQPIVSIAWDRWNEALLTPERGIEAFNLALGTALPRVAVTSRNLVRGLERRARPAQVSDFIAT